MPIFLWNKLWIKRSGGRGQPPPQKCGSTIDSFIELGQNYWLQDLRKYFSQWFREMNHVWKGMRSRGKYKNKTDAWVELCSGTWRWQTGEKAEYKSNDNHLIRKPKFITVS